MFLENYAAVTEELKHHFATRKKLYIKRILAMANEVRRRGKLAN